MSLPGRTKVTELVEQRYTEVKQRVELRLAEAESLNITTDTATTIAQHALQAVTAHWIDRSWKLCSALLENSRKAVFVRVSCYAHGVLLSNSGAAYR